MKCLSKAICNLILMLPVCLFHQPVNSSSDLSSLFNLVKIDRTEEALKIIKIESDHVNYLSPDNTSALHWAVYNNNVRLVKALIKAGANTNQHNDYGATPLSMAAENGNEAIIKALLKNGANVESRNPQGQTALMTIARTNHTKAARLLIKNGADVNATEMWRGQKALMWAVAHSQEEMVKLLLKRGANVNARSKIEKWERFVTAEPRPQNRPLGGLTPLLLAAREGCAACAQALINHGADLNLRDPNQITPLLMATLNARFDVAKVLIEAGADVNAWDMWGRAPLYSTIDYKTLPSGGRPDRPSSDETSPLQLINLLLEKGANPNMQLKLFPPYRSLGADRGGDTMLTVGTTPLIRAAKAGDVASIKLLLKYDALPNLKNWLGYTPLMAAAGLGSSTRDTRARFLVESHNLNAAKLLLEAGANLNDQDDRGRTALHGSAFWGWTEFSKYLIEKGADLSIKDQQGKTPLDTAVDHASTHALLNQYNNVK